MSADELDLKKKSKFLAFLLAILLGPLGFHNFYLGRWKRGFFQFGLAFLTVGAGLVITIPWAWTEGLLILVGKYSLGPKNTESDQGTIESEKPKVSPTKEYLIAILLLSPLLFLSIPFFGIPLLFAVLFYWLVGGLWNKTTRLFIKSVLPMYATIFGGGKKFLIRFSEYSMPPTGSRPELFKATRKLSITAIFVLFFLISIFAQSNLSMVTEGDMPDAVICDDGTFETADFLCDDGGVGTFCDPSCVLSNTGVGGRILEAYSDERVIATLIFAPFITVLIAPILVLRYSSLSIVDKNTRSMSPIGEKANDLTNVGAGFGSVVIFFQTAWKISSAAAADGNIEQGIGYVALILAFTIFMVLAFYPLIWLPMLKFTKAFESHVLLLDNSLVKSKGIEVHQLTYDNNELRITPVRESQEIKPELTDIPIPTPLVNPPAANNMIPSGPPIDTTPQSSDEHGFEWINHNGKDYYRPIGQMVDWKEFQN